MSNGLGSLLDPKAVSACLGCAESTLRVWRWRGEGPPYVKITRRMVRYPREGFVKYLRERGYEVPQ